MNKLLDSYWFRLTVASLLAFGGCYLTLADTGVLSSIPFMLICGAIAAIVMPRTAVTAALFAVFSLVYSSVYNDTLEAILTEFTACMLLALAGMAAVKLLQHRNTIRMVASVLCVVAALAAGVFLYGDICQNISASRIRASSAATASNTTVSITGFRQCPSYRPHRPRPASA